VAPRSGDTGGIKRHSRRSSEKAQDAFELFMGVKVDDQPATLLSFESNVNFGSQNLAKLLLEVANVVAELDGA
jgi:hypothetical protein